MNWEHCVSRDQHLKIELVLWNWWREEQLDFAERRTWNDASSPSITDILKRYPRFADIDETVSGRPWKTFTKFVSSANMIACSIVCSRRDYCNSILYGITEKNIGRLHLGSGMDYHHLPDLRHLSKPSEVVTRLICSMSPTIQTCEQSLKAPLTCRLESSWIWGRAANLYETPGCAEINDIWLTD